MTNERTNKRPKINKNVLLTLKWAGQKRNNMSEIIEQIRQAFIEQFQDDDWHVTDVQPCTDELYVDRGRYYEAIGTYVVEMAAMRDVDGLNKQGGYNKVPKGTKILQTIWLFSTGKVQEVCMQVIPIKPMVSHPFTIKAKEIHTPGYKGSETGWVEIYSQGKTGEKE